MPAGTALPGYRTGAQVQEGTAGCCCPASRRKCRSTWQIVVCRVLIVPKTLAVLSRQVIAGFLLIYPGRDTARRNAGKKSLKTPGTSWRLWEKKWKAEAGDAEFTAQLGALTALKGRYEAIEREYKNALVTLQHTSRERQEKKFLENCFIDACTSPKLGENGRPHSGHLVSRPQRTSPPIRS